MKVPPLRAYQTLKKSDLNDDEARRLVMIIKQADVIQGIAIMKSLRWSINKALNGRRIKKA